MITHSLGHRPFTDAECDAIVDGGGPPENPFYRDPRVPDNAGIAMQNILDELAQHGIAGLVFGGFIRDAMLGSPPADIDVLINTCDEARMDRLAWQTVRAPDGKPETDEDMAQLYGDSRLSLGYYLTPHSDIPVNIVTTGWVIQGYDADDVITLLHQLDFGLCQTGFNLEDGVRTTDAFDNDLRARCLNLRRKPRNAKDLARSRKRALRLSRRLGLSIGQQTRKLLQLD